MFNPIVRSPTITFLVWKLASIVLLAVLLQRPFMNVIDSDVFPTADSPSTTTLNESVRRLLRSSNLFPLREGRLPLTLVWSVDSTIDVQLCRIYLIIINQQSILYRN